MLHNLYCKTCKKEIMHLDNTVKINSEFKRKTECLKCGAETYYPLSEKELYGELDDKVKHKGG